MPPSLRLADGRTASLEPDPLRTGSLVLTVDGVEQSLIDPASPGSLDLEYMARLGAVVDAVAPPGDDVSVLHLGGGALSLARYTASTRPGSRQIVVEKEPGLVDFVLTHAPLPHGALMEVITGDASTALPPMTADLVVLDAYDGDEIPEVFFRAEVLTAISERIGPGGLLAVNVADDADHRRLDRLRASLSAVLPVTMVVGSASFAEHRSPGNAILLGSRAGAALSVAAHLLRAGPHPAVALA
jgi:spermidine synthase